MGSHKTVLKDVMFPQLAELSEDLGIFTNTLCALEGARNRSSVEVRVGRYPGEWAERNQISSLSFLTEAGIITIIVMVRTRLDYETGLIQRMKREFRVRGLGNSVRGISLVESMLRGLPASKQALAGTLSPTGLRQ